MPKVTHKTRRKHCKSSFPRMRKELQKMLVLGRNIGDTIVINDNIYITIFETSTTGNKFKVAIDAPAEMKISRGEHYANDAERWAKIEAMKAESIRRSKRAIREERAALAAKQRKSAVQIAAPKPSIGY